MNSCNQRDIDVIVDKLIQCSLTVLSRSSVLQRKPNVDGNVHNDPGLVLNANVNGMNIILHANVTIRCKIKALTLV